LLNIENHSLRKKNSEVRVSKSVRSTKHSECVNSLQLPFVKAHIIWIKQTIKRSDMSKEL